MKSVAKFAVGQSVEVGFNPPTPDLRVPLQANGKFPGKGTYQTKPNAGRVLAMHDEEGSYLVEVELKSVAQRNGREVVSTSYRKRVVHESKLKAV